MQILLHDRYEYICIKFNYVNLHDIQTRIHIDIYTYRHLYGCKYDEHIYIYTNTHV